MIVPLVSEEEWLEEFAGKPSFDAGVSRLVIVSPHPDDETLAAGGLIAKASAEGRDVLVIAVTDGDNAYPGETGLGVRREHEQAEALKVLSGGRARMVRLRLVDSGVSEAETRLAEQLREHIGPDCLVVAPWRGDYHPDHEACGRAAQLVAAEDGARFTWWFFWTWHRGTPADLRSLDVRVLPLTEREIALKQKAIACHESQLWRTDGDPILPPRLLVPAQRQFEVFAPC